MKKRIYLHLVRKLDADTDESYVRLIEMIVDGITLYHPGVTMQFWSDFGTYGLSEAMLYLQGYCKDAHSDMTDWPKLEEIRDKLQTLIE